MAEILTHNLKFIEQPILPIVMREIEIYIMFLYF